jgi:hypothetical protein
MGRSGPVPVNRLFFQVEQDRAAGLDFLFFSLFLHERRRPSSYPGRSHAAAAVDLEGDAGDEFGLVRAEPERGVGDVERRRELPSGMVALNLARFSGVSAPMKLPSTAVSPATGQRQLTRILSGANSTAIDLVMVIAAPFEAL